MKKTLIFCLAVLFIGFASTAAKAQAENDIFGYYTIDGRVPAAFADIFHIHLAGSYGAGLTPPTHGMIRPKKGKDFPLLKPTVNGKNISFSTRAVGGVSYKFTGTFVRFPNNETVTGVVLRGVLQKFKGKTKIAEARVGFTYEAGD
ncbi:MAG: hypothetical protein M3384_02550 [Acidobacteriota bacterium]|nr:hypothetical protein [Acidobacteriota bacterium]